MNIYAMSISERAHHEREQARQRADHTMVRLAGLALRTLTVPADPFAALLKRERLRAGVTVEDLAAALDVAPAVVQSWEEARSRPPHEASKSMIDVLKPGPGHGAAYWSLVGDPVPEPAPGGDLAELERVTGDLATAKAKLVGMELRLAELEAENAVHASQLRARRASDRALDESARSYNQLAELADAYKAQRDAALAALSPKAPPDDVNGTLALTLAEILGMCDDHNSTLYRHSSALSDGRFMCVAMGLGDIGHVLHHTAMGMVHKSERAFYPTKPIGGEAAHG